MSNSPLVVYTKLSPNHSGKRNHVIDTLAIHCMAGNLTVESCGAWFAKSSTQASSNYGIGTDGRIALYVDEANRSWCTSSREVDNRAVTIEVANNGTAAQGWPVSDAALNSLIKLCADICKRNGIKKLLWKADKSLMGQVDKQNMVVHRWVKNKDCPGEYLYSRHGYIADEVNKILGTSDTPTTITKSLTFNSAAARTVKVTATTLNVRSGPGTNYPVTTQIKDQGVYTITEVKGDWGKLKSGAGWISLKYTKDV